MHSVLWVYDDDLEDNAKGREFPNWLEAYGGRAKIEWIEAGDQSTLVCEGSLFYNPLNI